MAQRTHQALIAVLLGLCLGAAHAADQKTPAAAEPSVKKSESGICHDKSSNSYGNTKKFQAFASMDECIKSGGRAPAGAVNAEPIVKKSESGICHDKNSNSYGNTKKFTEFKTLDECVKSGGTLPKK